MHGWQVSCRLPFSGVRELRLYFVKVGKFFVPQCGGRLCLTNINTPARFGRPYRRAVANAAGGGQQRTAFAFRRQEAKASGDALSTRGCVDGFSAVSMESQYFYLF